MEKALYKYNFPLVIYTGNVNYVFIIDIIILSEDKENNGSPTFLKRMVRMARVSKLVHSYLTKWPSGAIYLSLLVLHHTG